MGFIVLNDYKMHLLVIFKIFYSLENKWEEQTNFTEIFGQHH
jgi:hypothetical protein